MLLSIPSSHSDGTNMDPTGLPELPVARGRILKRHVAGDPALQYNLFVSEVVRPETPLFIAVHGIRRGFDNQARLFAPLVNAKGGILVAPLFQRKRFSDYQRLGRLGKGDRADLALNRIVAEVSQVLGINFPALIMFGYSGGGQFVHRYAMAHPRQVKRMAIAAPGWYTFPDMTQPFPRGLRPTALLPDIIFDPARFLEIPTLAMVGEKDVLRDAALNRDKKISNQQGRTRVERGRRWIAAMAARAAQFNLKTPFRFELIAGCAHSFSECMQTGQMGSLVVDFLFEDQAVHDLSPAAQPPVSRAQSTTSL